MCRRGEDIDVTHVPVMVVHDEGHVIRHKYAPIDQCIAPLVRALNASGFPTTAACCGHNEHPALIGLADGRLLFIIDEVPGEPIGDTAVRLGEAFDSLNTADSTSSVSEGVGS